MVSLEKIGRPKIFDSKFEHLVITSQHIYSTVVNHLICVVQEEEKGLERKVQVASAYQHGHGHPWR